MKPKHLFIHIVAVLFAFPFVGAFAQDAPPRIEVFSVFEFPAGGVSTLPQKINDNAEISGVIDKPSTGARRGFVRFHNGHFTPSIVEPNDTGGIFTDLRAINNSRLLCGYYLNQTDGLFHGFFVSATDKDSFAEYDVPGASNTLLLGLNDAEDFCGGFNTASAPDYQPFLSIGGTVTTISIPDAVSGFAYGINTSNQVVGQYTDTGGIAHGFFRDSDGTVTAPIDPPGATATVLFGLNDRNLLVGRFTASDGIERGFVLKQPDKVVVLDNPESTLTSLNGINNNNVMCGRSERNGVAHGIIARFR